ncbi:MAG: hypothetical protein WC979_02900 [Candidatus Pacearchaeota archaeon]|jgi:hypothetical protein|nr:hypothetical protein [Clostridia bacterium]
MENDELEFVAWQYAEDKFHTYNGLHAVGRISEDKFGAAKEGYIDGYLAALKTAKETNIENVERIASKVLLIA